MELYAVVKNSANEFWAGVIYGDISREPGKKECNIMPTTLSFTPYKKIVNKKQVSKTMSQMMTLKDFKDKNEVPSNLLEVLNSNLGIKQVWIHKASKL